MSRGFARAERLQEMERLYLQRAYSDIEMADRLSTPDHRVDRTTVFRDRVALEERLPIEPDEQGRYRINRAKYLPQIHLNLCEALSLYLAARRASQQTRTAQKDTASALEKLALTLKQPMTERLVKVADNILRQKAAPGRDKVFEVVASAWVQRLRLRITYLGLHATQPYEDVFSPYLIEPSPWSDSVYVIGPSDRLGKVAPYRLDRIQRASLSSAPFSIPEDFDEQELLRHAWGIWRGEGAPETVRLKFAPGDAARRAAESVWHPLEDTHPTAEGGYLWAAPIAEWREMVPWVRQWGAGVEVLAPDALRRALRREAERLARLYGVSLASASQPAYYAHSRPDLPESEWQLLKEHLAATADLAGQLGAAAGIAELARIAGSLHDLGKYSAEFQARLRGSRQHVDHATAGAREVMALCPDPRYKDLAEMLSYCIAGHHGGLPDYGSPADVETDATLLARREKKLLKDYSAYKTEVGAPAWALPQLRIQPARFRYGANETKYTAFSVSFLTRMLFSTLVDADWLETERYMDDAEKPRGQYASLASLTDALNRHLERFADPQTPINRQRTAILNACRASATLPPGFFTLTVPTGGGKTLASMAFALNHAQTHGLQRVIYVIPFTSIIEQNAGVFRDALGELGAENVLEHHSNFDWEGKKKEEAADDETNEVTTKLKLAAENWDIPIVVTTNVQFFESLYASKKSQARKLHNLAKSVIIFDEAQTLPREYLKPCLLAVQELVHNYGCSAVFCTATQPSLPRFFSTRTRFTELAPDPQGLFDFFRRVRVTDLGQVTDDELLERLRSHEQVLCIVNTRRHARGLFDRLAGDGVFHLSTLMCPAHRKVVLEEIRGRLKAGERCGVISTQVMEAGIDVDFPVGYRALAGLDSIIQAAGRVNREMRAATGDVFVFRPLTDCIKRTPTFIKQTGGVAEVILRQHAADPTTVAAIEGYYDLLYVLQGAESFDAQKIINHFEKGTGQPAFDFASAAQKFKLIEQNTVTVLIPWNDNARQKIDWLRTATYPASVLRQLQPYAVNIYEYEFRNLQSKGALETIADAYYALQPDQMDRYYNPATGLVIPEHAGGDALFYE